MFLAFLPNFALGQACSSRLAAVHDFYADPKRNVAGDGQRLAMREEEVRGHRPAHARSAFRVDLPPHRIDPHA